MICFGLEWEEIDFYAQKHFRETNSCLCKVSTAKTMHERNDRSCKISLPVAVLISNQIK